MMYDPDLDMLRRIFALPPQLPTGGYTPSMDPLQQFSLPQTLPTGGYDPVQQAMAQMAGAPPTLMPNPGLQTPPRLMPNPGLQVPKGKPKRKLAAVPSTKVAPKPKPKLNVEPGGGYRAAPTPKLMPNPGLQIPKGMAAPKGPGMKNGQMQPYYPKASKPTLMPNPGLQTPKTKKPKLYTAY